MLTVSDSPCARRSGQIRESRSENGRAVHSPVRQNERNPPVMTGGTPALPRWQYQLALPGVCVPLDVSIVSREAQE
jgi:hypothetical protein